MSPAPDVLAFRHARPRCGAAVTVSALTRPDATSYTAVRLSAAWRAIGASFNGRTRAFGARYPGSNPGAPATRLRCPGRRESPGHHEKERFDMSAIALILAAGEGTRMKSDKPKVAHKILGVPMVRWVVDAAQDAGCERVIAITGHRAEQVEALLADVESRAPGQAAGNRPRGHVCARSARRLLGLAGGAVGRHAASAARRPSRASSRCASPREPCSRC